jgi:hypothetical protein
VVNWIPWRFSPTHATVPITSMEIPETGNRKNNRTLSLDCKSLASTCIPPSLRFQAIPRMVREPQCKSPRFVVERGYFCVDSPTFHQSQSGTRYLAFVCPQASEERTLLQWQMLLEWYVFHPAGDYDNRRRFIPGRLADQAGKVETI